MFMPTRCLLLAAICLAVTPVGFGQSTFVPTEDLESLMNHFRTAGPPLETGVLSPNMIHEAYLAIVATFMGADLDPESLIDELVLPGLINDTPVPDPERSSGVCAQDLDGQKYRAAGGSAPFAPVPHPEDGFWPAHEIQVVEPPTVDAGANTLVIIDDFDLIALERALARWDFAMWMSDASELQPHGHHVLYHTLRTLTNVDVSRMWWSAPVALGAADETELQWAHLLVPRDDGTQFVIVLVDFSMNVDLVEMAVHHVNSLTTASSGPLDAPGLIAVNMSWNLVPCRLLADYTAEQRSFDEGEAYASYHEYLVDVASDPGSQEMLETLRQAFDEAWPHEEWSAELDPLFTYLTILAASHHMAQDVMSEPWEAQLSDGVEWLASSGNQGMSFPLPPAVFEAVCAVGARQSLAAGNPMAPATWSNAASAHAPGAWFPFGSADGSEPPYAGTSFAAPFAALAYLAGDTTHTENLVPCIEGS